MSKPRSRWSPPAWTPPRPSWSTFSTGWRALWRPWRGHSVPTQESEPLTPPQGLPLRPEDHLALPVTPLAMLTVAVEANTAEVKHLRRSLGRRPSRAEVAHRRRVVTMCGLLLLVLGLFAIDQHVSSCASGVYPRQVVLLLNQGLSLQDALEAGRRPNPLCDVVTPLHVHDARQRWPSTPNAIGLVGYTLAFVAGAAFAFGPGHWRSPGERERRRP